jgi:hypothetical protein
VTNDRPDSAPLHVSARPAAARGPPSSTANCLLLDDSLVCILRSMYDAPLVGSGVQIQRNSCARGYTQRVAWLRQAAQSDRRTSLSSRLHGRYRCVRGHYAPFMTSSSPKQHMLRSAWRRTVRYLGSFPVLVFALAALAILVGALVLPPKHATTSQRLVISLITFAATTAAMIGLVYATAFAIVSYQRLRARSRDRSNYKMRNAATPTEAVGSTHVEGLRRFAIELKKRLDRGEPLWQTASYDEETRQWLSVFREHFPEFRPFLDILENEVSAIEVLRDRLMREVVEAGMDQPPWLPTEFIPRVVSLLERDTRTGILTNKQAFDWRESAGYVYLGQPEQGFRVLSATTPQDEIASCQRKFEFFVRNALTWPETATIKISWDVRNIVQGAVIRQLEAIT